MKPTFLKNSLGRVAVIFWLAVCAVAPGGRAATIDVTIQNTAFVPKSITINVGDTVRWTQKDSIFHTVTSGSNGSFDGKFDSGNLIVGGTTVFSFTFNTAGTIPYFCTPHRTFQTGTVIVKAAATPPSLALTSPEATSSPTAPANVTLNAAVTAGTSPVASVHFFQNGTDIGTVTTAPYSFVVSNLAAGTYSFTARAIDTLAATGNSGTVAVTVTAGTTPPSIALSSPDSGRNLAAPANVTLNAAVTVGSSPIHSVHFTLNGGEIGLATNAPYNLMVTNLAAGTYVFSAQVFDILGSAANSGTVTALVFTATASGITLTSPQTTNLVTTPGQVNLDAAVIVGSHPIQSVHFIQDGTDIGTDSTAPYSLVVSNLSAGTYEFTARAVDTAGGQTLSSAITVTVQPPPALIPAVLTGAEPMGLALRLTWTNGVPPYLVEKKQTLADTNWTSVATTSDTMAIVPRDGETAFYRVTTGSGVTATPFTVWMNGASEKPTAATTSATAFGSVVVEGTNLLVHVNFSGLSGVAKAAHIHGPGNSTNVSPVLIPLAIPATNSGVLSGKFNIAGLTADQRTALLTGKTYLNIHTDANPGGEIRGQVLPIALHANLNGAAERPTPVTTSATGSAAFWLIGNELNYDVQYSGLSGVAKAAHLHGPADATIAGPVIQGLSGTLAVAGSLGGRITLTTPQLGFVADGLTYVNIHTDANPGGEIRGQVVP